jgi:hypothetical protein
MGSECYHLIISYDTWVPLDCVSVLAYEEKALSWHIQCPSPLDPN